MGKKALYFLGGFSLGAAVGSIIAYVVTKKKVWEECDEEINKMRDEFTSSKKKDVPSNVKEALIKNWDKPPLKSTLYSFEDELAESEHPVDSDEDVDDIDHDEEKALDISIALEEEKRENEGACPVIISDEEIGDLSPGWEEREWTYYDEDGIMVDENNQIVDDFRQFVGNVLDDIGWIDDKDADDINIKAGEFMSIYRITKILRAFGDTDYASQQVYGNIIGGYN